MDKAQKNVKIWRFIAIYSLLLVCMIIVSDIIKYRRLGIIPDLVVFYIIANSIAACILSYFIYKPGNYTIYTLLAFSYGTANFLRGGSIIGFMLFLLCASFSYKRGLLRRSKKIRFILLATYAAVILCTQLRFGFLKFLNSLLHIGAAILFISTLFFLFKDEITRYIEASANRTIDLRDRGFSTRDIEFLKRVLNSEKYETIAREYEISLSTVKQRMKQLFQSLDVCDRIEFLARYSGVSIIWE